MLQLDMQQIVSQALSFLLLWWVLKRFAWKPLLKMLDERRANIEGELHRAAAAREELARLQAEYAQKLAGITDEARVKIQQAILEGKRVAMEIQEQARAQGHELLAKSKETMALELAKAKVTLRDQVAGMTLEALEKVLRQKLDPTTDRQLVEAALGDLEREWKA